MSSDTTVVLLERMLRETAAAHGRYEEEHLDGVYDVEWPAWYAERLAQALARDGFAIVDAGSPTARGPASPRL